MTGTRIQALLMVGLALAMATCQGRSADKPKGSGVDEATLEAQREALRQRIEREARTTSIPAQAPQVELLHPGKPDYRTLLDLCRAAVSNRLVGVDLRIDEEGRAHDLAIAVSSGSATCDEAALAVLGAATWKPCKSSEVKCRDRYELALPTPGHQPLR